MRLLKVCIAIAILVFIVQCFPNNNLANKKTHMNFNEAGELKRPEDYRSWVFAGSVSTPQILDTNALFPDFQNIYIDPEGYQFWKENGYFAEGTMMVKELLYATDKRTLPIGKGFVQGRAHNLAVTLKDTVRFPDVPGGWEYFDFGELPNGDYKDYTQPVGNTLGCIACHSNAEAGYGPFPELYAPLRDAKGFGKGSPENLKNRSELPSEKLKRLVP